MRGRLKGLTVLEVAILSAVVLASAAFLASMFLQPKSYSSQPAVVAIYSTFVLGPQKTSAGTALSALQQCYQIANGLMVEKILSSNKPIILGNPRDTYAYALVIDVIQPGRIKGVAIYRYGTNELFTLISKPVDLPMGRYLLCVFSSTYYTNIKLELVGAKGLCVNCYAR